MLENDLALIAEAARDAGALAMRFWNANPQVWEKPGLGPVTEADLAVNDLLAERAGAAVSDKHGRALRFNSPGAKTAGIFTAPVAVHSEILASFKA